jgi:hypothetical protein
MHFDRITYTVLEVDEGPQALSIDRTGHVRYESHTNAPELSRPEIGFYDLELPDADLAAIDRLVSAPALDPLPDHSGRIQAGARYRRLRVERGGGAIEKAVADRDPIDPALARILAEMDRVARLTLAHREAAVSLDVRGLELSASGAITATLVLSAAGKEPITCGRPTAAAEGDGPSFITVQMWPDKAASELRAADVVVAHTELVAEGSLSAGARSGPATLTMPGGALATYHLRAQTGHGGAVVAGARLVVRVIYTSRAVPPDARGIFQGKIYGEPFHVVVPVR